MNIWTIGFTKTTAERFFETLRNSGTRRLVDIRLNNVSQLAGFAKKQDLSYFLKTICGIEYEHLPILAPTAEMLDAYRKRLMSWAEYEQQFLTLMSERHIESVIPFEVLADSCLLCSEDRPARCHRRLVAEYLAQHWGGIEIQHLT
ncbi:MAG: DUF488 domain-containing protein [Chloroflexi bacterium]|nr:MAG: DUF488 domain-containing protein [Chloroflexota bacterium]